jgi:hypothetical protein
MHIHRSRWLKLAMLWRAYSLTAFDGGASASGIEGGQMMILRIAMLGAMVLCTASSAMAEEVLYCTDTAATGFSLE